MILVLINDTLLDTLTEKLMTSEYAKRKVLRISDQNEMILREPAP